MTSSPANDGTGAAKGWWKYILLLPGLFLSGCCWLEVVHRISLYDEYGRQPFVNHVSDGYFGVMYFVGMATLAVLVTGLFGALRGGNRITVVSYTVAAILPVSFMASLFFMNQTDMLVTYSEFIQNMGP